MKKVKEFLLLLWNRIVSKTPGFWKQVQKLALSVGISAVAVLVANGQFTLDLPDNLLTIIKYAVAVCAAIAGTAQLTKEDNQNV